MKIFRGTRFPRNFLGIYRGNSEEPGFGFLGISSKFSEGIPRKTLSSSEFPRKIPRKFQGKGMYNQISKSTRSIPRKFRGKPFCPRNFLGIFKIPPTAL
ncbi:hypothetical protein YC2023_031008 [Brassica napus]